MLNITLKNIEMKKKYSKKYNLNPLKDNYSIILF